MAGKSLKASIIIGGSVTSSFRRALGTTRDGLDRIGEAVERVERRKRLLATQIDTFGRMGKNVSRMREEYALLATQADKLRIAQSRLADAQDRFKQNRERRAELGGKISTTAMTLGGIIAGAAFPIRAASKFEDAMLGIAKQVDGARDEGGKLTAVYYEMAEQARELGRTIPLPTNSLIEMMTAGARMSIARENLADFTRTAAMMADAFELPAGELAGQMGKIAGLYKIPIPQIGELADAINFLDDNSESSAGGIIDVLLRMSGMATTVGMAAKDSAALASTFLTLGSSAEVAGTASNALIRILANANESGKKVKKGFKMLGLSAKDMQKLMGKDATKAILTLLDAMNKVDRSKRLIAATRIFGAEFGDDIAKLAAGADEFKEQLKAAKSADAVGSMEREFTARLQTIGAQMQMTANRAEESSVALGRSLVPVLVKLLDTFSPLMDRAAGWIRANEDIVKNAVVGVSALGALRLATLSLGYVWTWIKEPVLGTMRFLAKWRAEGAINALGRIGSSARFIGIALAGLTAPMALGIAALVAGAAIVWKYWQPIKAFFSGFGEVIGEAFEPLAPMWDKISEAVGKAWDWFKKLLTPVELTADQLDRAGNAGRTLGRYVVGAAQSVAAALNPLGAAVKWIFGDDDEDESPKAKALGNTPGRTPPAMPAPQSRASVANITQQNTFNVTQQPGESGEDFARRVAELTKQRDGVSRRGSLLDEAA